MQTMIIFSWNQSVHKISLKRMDLDFLTPEMQLLNAIYHPFQRSKTFALHQRQEKYDSVWI